jgi:hypothetical protein
MGSLNMTFNSMSSESFKNDTTESDESPSSSSVDMVVNPNTRYITTIQNVTNAGKIAIYDMNCLIVSCGEAGNYNLSIFRIQGTHYTWIKNYSIPSKVTVMKVNGDTLYIGMENKEIKAIDITNPNNPGPLDTKTLGQMPFDMLIEGSMLWVSTSSGLDRLYLYNITDPGYLNQTTWVAIGGPNRKFINRIGHYLLVGNQIVNTSIMNNPRTLSNIPLPWFEKIAFSGKIGILTAYTKTLSIYDFSDIFNPVLISSFSHNQQSGKGLCLYGRTLVSFGGNLVFVDLTDLESPIEIGAINLGVWLEDVYIFGDRIFITGENNIFFGYYATPYSDLNEGLIGTTVAPLLEDFILEGDNLYGTNKDFLDVYDITDITSMSKSYSISSSGLNSTSGRLVNGFYIGGNETIDVQDPSSTKAYKNANDMFRLIYGQTGYQYDYNSKQMMMFNISNPTHTIEKKHFFTLRQPQTIYENYLLMANSTSIEVSQLTNPLSPKPKNLIEGPEKGAENILKVGSNLYIGNSSSVNMYIYDGGGLPALNLITSFYVGNHLAMKCAQDNFLFKQDMSSVWIINASDPLGSHSTVGLLSSDSIQSIKTEGDMLWLYLGSGTQELQVYRWLNLFAGDYDDDGINGLAEAFIYSTDPNDNDTDGDGMDDGYEIGYKTILDPLDPADRTADIDGDLLQNIDEYIYQTDPGNPDTDNDNLNDGEEVNDIGTSPINDDSDGDTIHDDLDDQDGDHLANIVELQAGSNPKVYDSDYDGVNDYDEYYVFHSDPNDADSDNDLLTDYEECYITLTDPNLADTDDDDLSDYEERVIYNTNPLKEDSDGDSLTDYEEVITYGSNPNLVDTDFDGLTDSQEVSYGTNVTNIDTDFDGLTDFQEIFTYKTNATNSDTDGDTLLDGYEVQNGMNPLDTDTDGDFLTDDIDWDPTVTWFTLLGTFGTVIIGMIGLWVKMRSMSKEAKKAKREDIPKN